MYTTLYFLLVIHCLSSFDVFVIPSCLLCLLCHSAYVVDCFTILDGLIDTHVKVLYSLLINLETVATSLLYNY